MKKLIKFILPDFLYSRLKSWRRNAIAAREKRKEENTVDFKNRVEFYSRFLQEGDIYFDIGANYGNRIAPILKIGVRSIVAVEPQTDCCEYLRERFKNITVIQQGAGEKEETKLFLYCQRKCFKFIL